MLMGAARKTREFEDEMENLWGPYGADSECGVLRQVLMHVPGDELALVSRDNFEDWLFMEMVDADRLRAQVQNLIRVYESHGVDVRLVQKQRSDRPNAMFVRDLMLTTHQGVVLARPGHPVRRGEERAVAETLATLGMPILRSIAGEGTYDGACAMLVDRDLLSWPRAREPTRPAPTRWRTPSPLSASARSSGARRPGTRFIWMDA